MATHALFTIVADIADGKEADLDRALEGFDTARAFAGLPDLHFASFVVFPGACLKSAHDARQPPSKLILECSIDGPIRPFLRRLVRHCQLDVVFEHCKGYDAGSTDATLAYLSRRVRKPQLYHVGTPHLSKASIQADRRTRDGLEARLRAASAGWLNATLSRTTAGQREYWRWEILKPWSAAPMAIVGLLLAWWLYTRTDWPHEFRLRDWENWVPALAPALFELLIAVGAVVLSLALWLSSVAEFRQRVTPWIGWALVATLLAVVSTKTQDGPRALTIAVWILDGLFAIATLYGIGTAVAAARDERLRQLRAGGSTESAWRTLTDKPRDSFEPRRSWPWLRIAKVLAFVLAFLATVGFFQYVAAGADSPASLMAGMTALMLLRGVWLTLRGFRADGLWLETSRGIAAFLMFAALAGLAAGGVLTQITSAYLRAALLLFAWSTLDRLWDWRWWIIGYASVYLLARPALEAHDAWLVVAVVTSVFLLKGLWLAVLFGWPGPGRWRQPAGLVAVATLVGLFLSSSLMQFSSPPSLTTLVLLLALFALWGLSFSSPDAPDPKRSRQKLQKLLDQEDRDVQNHMAALVPVREDWFFRAPVLRSFLWLLNRLFFRSGWLRDLYKGKLFGLPTVHFCQWVLLDNRNYIFLSNYDHSWTTYLDDFGTTIASGIDKIWGQGQNYPGTSNLERFKQYARSTMQPHSGWYPAYPGLTLRQIWNNELIARGARRADDEESMIRLLRRFGAAPKTMPELFHESLR
jgi:hypothetical protein